MKTVPIVLTVLTAAIVVGSPVSAQEPDCENPQSQVEMTGCAGLAFEDADRRLNEIWPRLLEIAEDNDILGIDDARPSYEETLRQAQRAWIGFRDANCTFEGFQARGGTMEPMLISGCLARMTEARIKELADQIQAMGSQ